MATCGASIWTQRDGHLDIVHRSLRLDVPEADRLDASATEPWRTVIGSALAGVVVGGPCVLRLMPATRGAVWVVAGNYLDDLDTIDECGDSVLVVHDASLAETYGLA